MRSRLVFALLLAASCRALAGCEGSADEAPPEGDLAPGPADASADGAAPRRPAKRHYMTRTDKRCELYWVEGDAISPPVPVPCPAVLDIGERIRMSGKSCFREGTPAREQPVVCPGEMLFADQSDRELAQKRDAGAGNADAGADAGAGDAGKRAASKISGTGPSPR